MPIVSNPREIRIPLDPTHGFPVGILLESSRHIEEGGEKIADLASHIESLAPDSPLAIAAIGDLASAATTALLPYQAEVQRLAKELESAKSVITFLESRQL